MKAKKIVVRLEDINYIPEYKIEEQQRRINEVERQENEAERQAHETERIALYEDMQEKLETGYFNGEDGYSPSASVSKSGNTTTITVTDKEGTTTALVLDGVDGTDGSDGQDAKINGVNTLTIEAGSNITLEQEESTLTISSTGGGTSDYSDLSNKPKINNVELSGNKTTSDLGIDIPDVSDFITKDVNNLTNYTKTSDLSTVATSGSYEDLSNKPTIPTKTSDLTNNSGFITNVDLTNYVQNTDYASNNTGGVIKTSSSYATAVATNGTLLTTTKTYSQYESGSVGMFISKGTLENVITGKQLVNSTDLATKQDVIDSTHKLDASYIDDSISANKFVTTSEKTAWNDKYNKPSIGIPSTDLASAVQTSLSNADTALQTSLVEEKDMVVTYSDDTTETVKLVVYK